MTKYWKVGELAKLTGLSIRTLRYYDQIQLFSPSEYTDSGHRRYSHGDLQKLHEILVLKQMGLSLEEIQEIIRSDESNSVMETIDKQINRIREDINIGQQLLDQLEQTRSELESKASISVKELTSLFELMKMNRSKYFSNTQLREMKRYYEQVDQDTLKAAEEEFQEVLINLRLEQEKGTSPKSKSVQDLAMRWEDMAYSFSKGDTEIGKNAEAFYADHPGAALQFGLDAELYRYIREALGENERGET